MSGNKKCFLFRLLDKTVTSSFSKSKSSLLLVKMKADIEKSMSRKSMGRNLKKDSRVRLAISSVPHNKSDVRLYEKCIIILGSTEQERKAASPNTQPMKNMAGRESGRECMSAKNRDVSIIEARFPKERHEKSRIPLKNISSVNAGTMQTTSIEKKDGSGRKTDDFEESKSCEQMSDSMLPIIKANMPDKNERSITDAFVERSPKS